MAEARDRNRITQFFAGLVALATLLVGVIQPVNIHAKDGLPYWRVEFPATDFTKRIIDLKDIRFDGPRRDSIPPIWSPTFIPAAKAQSLGALEPVISIRIGKNARAYPLSILLWHEIVNDRVGNTPLVVTYCPLCNSSGVFERQLPRAQGAKALLFGNTGRLRNFDMIMYDRLTQSWWQQYTGEAIIGKLAGTRLQPVPSRVEAFNRFRARHPEGQVLVPNDPKARPYGSTPYVRMDSSVGAGLDIFELPKGVRPYDRVVAVGRNAWTLKMLKRRGVIADEGLVLRWQRGQNSIHDTKVITFGRDVGNVTVKRHDAASDTLLDVVHDVAFAFTFKAFEPNGALYYDPPRKKTD